MAPKRQRSDAAAATEPPAGMRRSADRRPVVRRRTRLVRGPLTIGDPAPAIAARLATAEPYRADTLADGGEVFGLTVRAASVRGLHKRYVGGPRQDDLCLRVHVDIRTLIVAVADGVTAAGRSDLGAALAVRHAAAAVARQLEHGVVQVNWGDVFEHAAWALVEEHRRTGLADAGVGIEGAAGSLATTLTIAVISAPDGPGVSDLVDAGDRGDVDQDPVRVQLAAVGDSPAFVLVEGRFEPIVGEGEPVDGFVGGGVRALPRDPRAFCAGACTLGPGSVLLVCTDGLALPLADGAGEVGRTLARELASPPDIVDFARLLDFSRSTYDDDRTLIAVWPQRPQ